MKKSILSNNIIQQIGFGLTAAALIGSYCVCACAALGQGLLSVVLCCAVCFFVSLKVKNGVYAPDAFLLVPMFYTFSVLSPVSACISVLSGSFVFIGLRKILKGRKIPDAVITGAALSLAVGVTILLTNHYFGIGATGETPFEMLKSFRSLGFHPNFRGLLYGTITLFTMITYPFKFRKLNKYIPAEFITILIPFILNLFLNPQQELTTINETEFLSVTDTLKNSSAFFTDFSASEIPLIIKTALATGVILFGYSTFDNSSDNNSVFIANALSGGLSGLPVRRFSVRGYGKISAVTAFAVTVVSVLIFPNLFSRLPLHCAGSMLIVSAWQSVPYKSLAEVFKKKDVISVFIFALCTVPFISSDIFTAVIVYLIIMVIYNKKSPLLKERSGTNEN